MECEEPKRQLRQAQQKLKKVEQKVHDIRYRIEQEWAKAQRTAKAVYFQAAFACDSFYERIHTGIECIRDATTSTSEDKEMSVKERCYMINTYQRGVEAKRFKIEAQTKGHHIQTFGVQLPKSMESSHRTHESHDKATGEDIERDGPSKELVRKQKGGPEKLALENHKKSLVDEVDLSPASEETDDEIISIRREIEERDTICGKLGLDSDSRNDVDSSDGVDLEYWYRKQDLAARSSTAYVENKVVLKKEKPTKSWFGGGSSHEDTLDQIVTIWRKNLEQYHLTE